MTRFLNFTYPVTTSEAARFRLTAVVLAGLLGAGMASAQALGGAAAGGGKATGNATSGSTAAGSTGAVGTGVNGQSAGTSGTNPGVSAPAGTAGTTTPSSDATLGAVGGASAGTSATNPGTAQGVDNPLNRNPANRNNVPDAAPVADPANSSTRPTQGSVQATDSRDTVITPDPSRDTVVPSAQ